MATLVRAKFKAKATAKPTVMANETFKVLASLTIVTYDLQYIFLNYKPLVKKTFKFKKMANKTFIVQASLTVVKIFL